MGTLRFASLAVAVLAGLFLVGCKKKIDAPEAMGDAAPTYGSEHKDIKSFVVGKWCPATGIDPDKAEKFGVDPGSEIDVSQYWDIRADGTFIYTHTGSPDKVSGKWEEYQGAIVLNYEMWNDKTLADHRAAIAKAAEGGGAGAVAEDLAIDSTYKMFENMGYLIVSEDKKGLVFSSPDAPSGAGGGDLFSMFMETPLARMK